MRDSASRPGPRTSSTASVSVVPGKFPLTLLPFLTFPWGEARGRKFLKSDYGGGSFRGVAFRLKIATLKETILRYIEV